MRRSKFGRALRIVCKNLFTHNIFKNAGALAYFLLFAIFPLMIFVSNLLGMLDLNVYTITQLLSKFLPDAVVGVVESYLGHIANNSSHVLLWFSLIFSIWFPFRAVQGLMDDVRRAYGLGMPNRFMRYMVKQLIYTIVFLIVTVITLFLSALGKNVLGYINEILPESAWQASEYLLKLWQYLRFVPMGILMLFAIGVLYSVSLDKRPKIKEIMPGIGVALVSWMIVSMGFSFYAESFGNYSIIYGTLGAVIALLVWLYCTAITLIIGAEFNAALALIKEEDESNNDDNGIDYNASKVKEPDR